MRALLIETSTERGLAALVDSGKVQWSEELPFGYHQSKFLMPLLHKHLSQVRNEKPLDCIGVGIGPGSYTGIRIGVAAAKALAYAWHIPLIGVASLSAFVPDQMNASFAAILDAKMGGAYLVKGKVMNGLVTYEDQPLVCPLVDLMSHLNDVEILVSPACEKIQEKVKKIYPEAPWKWQECSPSAHYFGQAVWQKYQKREWSLDGQLDLLYLRKSQAEIESTNR